MTDRHKPHPPSPVAPIEITLTTFGPDGMLGEHADIYDHDTMIVLLRTEFGAQYAVIPRDQRDVLLKIAQLTRDSLALDQIDKEALGTLLRGLD